MEGGDAESSLHLLAECFPDREVEELRNILNYAGQDIELAILLAASVDREQRGMVLARLVEVFPEQPVSRLEQFLAQYDDCVNEPVDELVASCMLYLSMLEESASRQRARKVRIPIDAGSISVRAVVPDVFPFSFAEIDEDLTALSGSELRQMANDLQASRIGYFKRAASTFQGTNLTAVGTAQYLSDQGHSMSSAVERLHRMAAQKCLVEKNAGLSGASALDLHGLRVAEAVEVTEAFLAHHRQRRSPSVKIITGRGSHSESRASRLTPAVITLLRNGGFRFSIDNFGNFMVQLP